MYSVFDPKKQIKRAFDDKLAYRHKYLYFSIKHVVGIHLNCLGEAILMNNNRQYFIE